MSDAVFNPYEVLGLDVTASEAEITMAFRRAAAKAHPDRGGSTEAMKDINMAYKILSDPEMRKAFDASGAIGKKDQVWVDARDLLINFLQAALRSVQIDVDLIDVLRSTCLQHKHQAHQTLVQQENATKQQLDSLHRRLSRLKGPENNFMVACIQDEIHKGNTHIEEVRKKIQKDQEVLDKAIEILVDFSYDVQRFTPGAIMYFDTPQSLGLFGPAKKITF